VGIAGLAELAGLRSSRLPRVVATGLILVAAMQPLFNTLRTAESSGMHGPSRLADAVLDSAPPGALILLGGDGWVFPALLARYREGRRADVSVAGLLMLDLDGLPALSARGFPVPAELSPALLAAARSVEPGGCCLPELLAAGFVASGMAEVLVNEAFLPPDLEVSRRPFGLLYRLGASGRWEGDEAHAAEEAESRLWSFTVEPLTRRSRSRDLVLEGLLSRRYMARAGFMRSRGQGEAALRALRRGSSIASEPWSMVHLHRHRAEEGLAPIAPADGSGGFVEPDGSAAGAIDLLALRGTIRLVNDDPKAAREDISAVLAQHPDHPLALPAAERLMTLGLPVEVTIRAGRDGVLVPGDLDGERSIGVDP
jgi:hypothetical protein